MSVSRSHRLILLGLPAVLVAGVLAVSSSATNSSGAVTITTLSNRADLISGGDALVAVSVPQGAQTSSLRVSLNGRDITSTFAVRANKKYEGLVKNLAVGANSLVAALPDGRGAKLKIINRSQGGAVLAGPQIGPWTCQAGARDKQCNQAPTFTYYYVPAGANGQFREYDPQSPPSPELVATTTTTEGMTVPFMIRQEVGYIDRDQYAIAVLFDPKTSWSAWAPQKAFNKRLVITHGASCDTGYAAGTAPSVQNAAALGAGFIVMSNALDNAGHNCSIATQAESLIMTKEYLIDHYGEVRWTIGSGCSGGSLVQQQVANAYPGLYQGISPQCSFTDAWSSAMQYEDYVMLLKYFEDPSRWDLGSVWGVAQVNAVLDHPNPINPVTFTTAIPNSGKPNRTCPGLAASKVFDPKTNPKGVRCTLQDYMVNVFGKDPKTGFALRAFGNVGIQYGLKALRAGVIGAAQFVDLNTNIGGLDSNADPQAKRSAPDDLALKRAYDSGAVDSANNLDKVAIIDLRGPDPGAFHDVYRTYAMRARLMRNFGTAANQVLWRGQVPLMGDKAFADEAIFALDKWLARVDADKRSVPLAAKIIQDKPGTVAERCTNGGGVNLPSSVCDLTVAAYGTPRLGADMPMSDDVLQCQLKPMRADDYPVAFAADLWARLKAAFPKGVCDYSKPGVHQHGATAWMSYQDDNAKVVYGGRPLGSPPQSVAFSR